MRILISGGCKNGKSHYAQYLAKAQQKTCYKTTGFGTGSDSLYYVATMRSVDPEDDERIAQHRQDRDGWGFTTVEQTADIEKILDTCGKDPSVLLDSLTALLANEMFPRDGTINEHAAEKITGGLSQVLGGIANIVLVSDYIYGDAKFYDPITEMYRKSLAAVDREAARMCDAVLEIVYTHVIVHKGGEAFEALYRKIR